MLCQQHAFLTRYLHMQTVETRHFAPTSVAAGELCGLEALASPPPPCTLSVGREGLAVWDVNRPRLLVSMGLMRFPVRIRDGSRCSSSSGLLIYFLQQTVLVYIYQGHGSLELGDCGHGAQSRFFFTPIRASG